MKVFKEFTLYCAHSVIAFGVHHKCSKKHGHSYRIRVSVECQLGLYNVAIPFSDLEEIADRVKSRFDHTDLNESLKSENPTTELLAIAIANEFTSATGRYVTVEVKETDSSGVIFSTTGY